MLELTVFIVDKIPSLKATSRSKFEIVSKIETVKSVKINIKIDKKYLFISAWLTWFLENDILLKYICLGREWDNNSLIENFINEKILINLNPELVEKKDPPITTKIKKTKYILLGIFSEENPIFEILLAKERNNDE